uniref:Uncharacterized protein n=1 Tax=Kwoniella dejecticola CBS 10117 TaxID=1296121 RepID=A0A1A6AE60_9TREE|nr:uncharacterized protein I303_00175 [Kwoniella dejecticola CBS 10117]OBR88362.1 hypothetical protein I303_00175 [Kwoniella dejecticola CBS 10117]
MLLANYASDSDSDAGSDAEVSSSRIAAPAPAPAPVHKTAPKPAAVRAKKPVKITLGLSKADIDYTDSVKKIENGTGEVDDEEERESRDSKRPKIAGGKGSSSLLGMLPPPKRKLSQASANRASSLKVNKSMANPSSSSMSTSTSSNPKINIPKPLLASTKASSAAMTSNNDGDDDDEDDANDKMLPPSLAKKDQKQKEEESFDLFGLSKPSNPIPASSSTSTSILRSNTISSAPLAPDYVPPEPTPNDPYPGYYQLPNGEWKAYDPEYYNSFFPQASQAAAEEEEEDGRVGKHWKEFNDGQFAGNLVDVSATAGIAEARAQEQISNMAKRKKVNENEFEYKPVGQIKGLASQRHQLTSLLNTAYTQREELEDRIAHNKKNMRMAGTKYGTFLRNTLYPLILRYAKYANPTDGHIVQPGKVAVTGILAY